MFEFNMNDYVKVKLNETGLAALRTNHNELYHGYGNRFPHHEPVIDEEGYTKYQLWDLMHQFGSHIYLGGRVPFDTKIIFLDPPVF